MHRFDRAVTCKELLLGEEIGLQVELDARTGVAHVANFAGWRSSVNATLVQRPNRVGDSIEIRLNEPTIMHTALNPEGTSWPVEGTFRGTFCGETREAPRGMRLEIGRCQDGDSLLAPDEGYVDRWQRSAHKLVNAALYMQAGAIGACFRDATHAAFWANLEVDRHGRAQAVQTTLIDASQSRCVERALQSIRFSDRSFSTRASCPFVVGRAPSGRSVVLDVEGQGVKQAGRPAPDREGLEQSLFRQTRSLPGARVRLRVTPDAGIRSFFEALAAVQLFELVIERIDTTLGPDVVYETRLPRLPHQRENTLLVWIRPQDTVVQHPLEERWSYRLRVAHRGGSIDRTGLADALRSMTSEDAEHGDHPPVLLRIDASTTTGMGLDVLAVLNDLPLGDLEVEMADLSGRR